MKIRQKHCCSDDFICTTAEANTHKTNCKTEGFLQCFTVEVDQNTPVIKQLKGPKAIFHKPLYLLWLLFGPSFTHQNLSGIPPQLKSFLPLVVYRTSFWGHVNEELHGCDIMFFTLLPCLASETQH